LPSPLERVEELMATGLSGTAALAASRQAVHPDKGCFPTRSASGRVLMYTDHLMMSFRKRMPKRAKTGAGGGRS